MDPITLAITSALGAGAAGAGKRRSLEGAIGDAYQALKVLLKKFGSESDPAQLSKLWKRSRNQKGGAASSRKS